MIFVSVSCAGTKMRVSGDTSPISKQLGCQGVGLKFSKARKDWRGPASLKALEFCAAVPGAILDGPAQDALQAFQKAAEKRAAYMTGRKP